MGPYASTPVPPAPFYDGTVDWVPVLVRALLGLSLLAAGLVAPAASGPLHGRAGRVRAPPRHEAGRRLHQRTRLGPLAVLHETQQADFGYLKKLLKLTGGNLGRHLDVPAQQGLVHITKGYQRNRPRTRVEISDHGRAALAAEMAALKGLVQRFENSLTPTGSSELEEGSGP